MDATVLVDESVIGDGLLALVDEPGELASESNELTENVLDIRER